MYMVFFVCPFGWHVIVVLWLDVVCVVTFLFVSCAHGVSGNSRGKRNNERDNVIVSECKFNWHRHCQ